MDRSHLSQLAVLSVVAAHGSFRGAARELAIAPSAVSHAISSLEEELGLRLLARTTRSVAPTEAGATLLERLRPALGEIELALEAALETRDRPAGNLRITMPRTAAHLIFAPRIGAFATAFPDITLELVIEDRFADVVAGGFDAGVRLGESLQPDMIAVKIGPDITSVLVGSPEYFKTMPRPAHPRDLAGHRCIRFRFSSGVIYRWEFEKDGEAIELVGRRPAHPWRGQAGGGGRDFRRRPGVRVRGPRGRCPCRRPAHSRDGRLVPVIRRLLSLLSQPAADAAGACAPLSISSASAHSLAEHAA